MYRGNRRKTMVLATAAGAVVLSTASVAYACTLFMGQMSVTGNGRGPDGKHHTVNVIGNGGGMGYCDSPSQPLSARAVNDDAGYTYLNARKAAEGSLRISLAPYVDPRDPGPYPQPPDTDLNGCTAQLPDGLYNVNWFNGPGFVTTRPTALNMRAWSVDCMYYDNQYDDIQGTGVKNIGTITVTGGRGGGEFTVPGPLVPNVGTDESAVCTSNEGKANPEGDDSGLYGLQAPVVVL